MYLFDFFCLYYFCFDIDDFCLSSCVSAHMSVFSECACSMSRLPVHPSLRVHACGATPPPRAPEAQEVSVDNEASLGGAGIPEISVTGVSGERMPNGDSVRPRLDGRIQPECDALGGASEVSLDPRSHESSTRGQEVRRQKSVRRMVENEGSGPASTGRSQY